MKNWLTTKPSTLIDEEAAPCGRDGGRARHGRGSCSAVDDVADAGKDDEDDGVSEHRIDVEQIGDRPIAAGDRAA